MSSWLEELCSRLEVMREIAVSNALTESAKRKVCYDNSSVDRTFCEGNKVLCRIPGAWCYQKAWCRELYN